MFSPKLAENCHPEQLTCLRQVEGGMNNICVLVITTITPNGDVPLPFVIPSAAEGSAGPRTIPGNVFRQTSHKIVILSAAPHRFIACYCADSAESKDPEDAYPTHAARSFSTPKPAPGEPAMGLSLGPRTPRQAAEERSMLLTKVPSPHLGSSKCVDSQQRLL